MIKPTVGRVVWFRPDSYNQRELARYDHEQPMAATVAFVHTDRVINISVVDHAGQQHSYPSVTLVQDGDVIPSTGPFCEWMPFQKGQAVRTEQLEAERKINIGTGG